MVRCRGCDAPVDVWGGAAGFCDRCAEEVAWMVGQRGRRSHSLLSLLWARLKGVEERQAASVTYRNETFR
jgi:hypothetical protein